MSDNKKKKRLIHTTAPMVQPAPILSRLESLEQALKGLVDSLPQFIAAGSLAAGQKIYDQIAREHGRIFQVQEAAFLAIAEMLDRRLRVLEDQHGLASPSLHGFRDILEAIADYTAAAAEDGYKPWKDLDAEEQERVVGAYVSARDTPRERQPALTLEGEDEPTNPS